MFVHTGMIDKLLVMRKDPAEVIIPYVESSCLF